MEKVKAPATGWLSAETTCQATVYVPSGSPACSRDAVRACDRCSVARLAGVDPLALRVQHAQRVVGQRDPSEKVSVTCVGRLVDHRPPARGRCRSARHARRRAAAPAAARRQRDGARNSSSEGPDAGGDGRCHGGRLLGRQCSGSSGCTSRLHRHRSTPIGPDVGEVQLDGRPSRPARACASASRTSGGCRRSARTSVPSAGTVEGRRPPASSGPTVVCTVTSSGEVAGDARSARPRRRRCW